MRILAVSALLGPGLLVLTASCASPPPEAAAPPPAAAIAEPAPIPLAAPPPATAPAVVAAPPSAPVAVAARPAPPAPEINYVPIPALWLGMLTKPAPAGRLLLNNFTFEPSRIQAVLATGPACGIDEFSTVTEFVLPPNGTRILPAPPGWDICWRRERVGGETTRPSSSGPWTSWNRAYTGPGRFLEAAVLPPSLPVAAAAAVERAPASSVPSAPPMVPK